MKDLEPQSVATAGSEDLQQTCAALQRQITTLLLGLVILSCTLTIFLWRQSRYSRADLNNAKPAVGQIFQAFNQEKPSMEAFVSKLVEYGRAHPDFMPILDKYKIQIPATSAATAKPAPAAPAKTTPAAPPKK